LEAQDERVRAARAKNVYVRIFFMGGLCSQTYFLYFVKKKSRRLEPGGGRRLGRADLEAEALRSRVGNGVHPQEIVRRDANARLVARPGNFEFEGSEQVFEAAFHALSRNLEANEVG
jgi:hypothetical protein